MHTQNPEDAHRWTLNRYFDGGYHKPQSDNGAPTSTLSPVETEELEKLRSQIASLNGEALIAYLGHQNIGRFRFALVTWLFNHPEIAAKDAEEGYSYGRIHEGLGRNDANAQACVARILHRIVVTGDSIGRHFKRLVTPGVNGQATHANLH